MTAAQQYGQGLAASQFQNLANTYGQGAAQQYQQWYQPAATQANLGLQNYQLAQGDVQNTIRSTLANNQALLSQSSALGGQAAAGQQAAMMNNLMALYSGQGGVNG